MENKSFLEKALVKAEKTLEATPEYKDWKRAEEAEREACRALNETREAYEKASKATDEAWKAVEATPEYKPYKKAFEAYMKPFTIREFREDN